jgi:peptidylprolyl isomerase
MTNTKPEIEPRMEAAPTQLIWADVIEGSGERAVAGAVVEVHYLGVDYESGEEFDSSWNRGESITFPLSSLIRGWQEGIPGMKVGGRRELICPPEWAYGPAGGGHRLSGQTLVFAIDLLATTNP